MRNKNLPTNIRWTSVHKKLFVFVAFILLFTAINAQNGVSYFIYRVKKGESFRSVAAKYNITPYKLADFNNLDFYEGSLAAKTLRIPKKQIKKNVAETTSAESKVTPDTIASTPEPLPATPAPEIPTPVDSSIVADTLVVVGDTSFKQVTEDMEMPTIQTDVQKHLPLIIFLGAGVLLLILAIAYYRSVNRR